MEGRRRITPPLSICLSLSLLLALALSLSAFPRQAFALFEDQVGMYDWYQQYVGKASLAVFQTSGQRKRVYVATEQNMVTALNLRTGDVAWRRALGLTSRVQAMAVYGRYVVTASTDGSVHAWALADGTLAWEAFLQPSPSSPAAATPATSSSLPLTMLLVPKTETIADVVVISYGGAVHALSLGRGELLWTTPPSLETVTGLLTTPGGALAAISLVSATALKVSVIHPATGALVSAAQLTAPAPVDPTSLLTTESGWPTATLMLDQSGAALLALRGHGDAAIKEGSEAGDVITWTLTSTPVSSLLADMTGSAELAAGAAADDHAVLLKDRPVKGGAWLQVGKALLLLRVGSSSSVGAADGSGGQLAVVASVAVADGGGVAVSSSVAVDLGGGNAGEAVAVATWHTQQQAEEGGLGNTTRKVSVQVFSVSSPEGVQAKVFEEPFALPLHRGGLSWLALNSYSKASSRAKQHSNKVDAVASAWSAVGFRFLSVSNDDALSLFQQGEAVWEREEALASVQQSVLLDFPHEHEHDHDTLRSSVVAIEHSLADWVQSHWLKAKVSIGIATADEQALVHRLRTSAPGKSRTTYDYHGFRRILVTLTRTGKLVALHTGDGSILWSTLLPLPVPWPSADLVRLLVWRDELHVEQGKAPQLVVVACEGKEGCSISTVNGFTGGLISAVHLPVQVAAVLELPGSDAAGHKVLLLPEKARQGEGELVAGCHLVSDASLEDTLNLVAQAQKKGRISFHVVDEEGGVLAGYEVEGVDGGQGERRVLQGVPLAVDGGSEQAAAASEGATGGVVRAVHVGVVQTWQMVLPRDSEVVAATAAPAADEAVHTQVRVLGDRSVEYKLVSPNFLFVATLTPTSSPSSSSATSRAAGSSSSSSSSSSGAEGKLTVYVVDTVTGAVVARETHRSAAGPVHAVFSENWVVYHFFNPSTHRFQVSSLELLDLSHEEDGPIPALRYGLGIPGTSPLTAPRSSWETVGGPAAVKVLSQSYFFPYAVRTLGVTQTGKGITPRHVLFGTALDQVLSIDRRFVDPRRKRELSQADKEAGIIPYTENLQINPMAYRTHKYRVEGLRGVVCFPTRLESTTLLFAFGNDVFLARVAPSNVFDSLTDDFSFALLLVTIVALVVAIGVAWVLAKRQDLYRRWR